MSVKFTNSCAPISLPCTVGAQYIKPCTCREYFQCDVNVYTFLSMPCSRGTAWNHNTKRCDTEDKIFIAAGTPICERDEPWLRCSNVKDSYSLTQLQNSCENGGDPNGNNGSGNSGDGDSGGGSNAGAIVGGVLPGLLVVALAIAFVFWWKKKRHTGTSTKSQPFRPTIHIQHPHREKEDEDVYDVIDEKSIQVVPVVENMAYGKERATEYDNPAFSNKSETDNYSYNDLTQQPQHHHQQQQRMDLSTSHNQSLKPPTRIAQGVSNGRTNQLSDFSREDDLSRSISVGGQDVLVEDSQGYHIGYPSGTIPRQPSPLPFDADDDDDNKPGNDVDYGYDLGKRPFPNDYMELEKTDL